MLQSNRNVKKNPEKAPSQSCNLPVQSGRLVHGGDIYSAREKLGTLSDFPEILDFSANINPLGLPEGVRRALVDSVKDFDVYPDPLCRELVRTLASHEGISGEWILCGNGAADLIFRTVYAVKPKKAMVLAPTFAEYEEALHAAGCRVIRFPLQEKNGFRTGEDFLDALHERPDILFLCNPNNPTGQLIPGGLLLKILRRCREFGILLFLDECFNDFLDEPQAYSLKDQLKTYDNLIILKAFTKIYAMAGIRLGHCMTSNADLLRKIREAGQPWSVSAPAQLAGVKAVEEKSYIEETRQLIDKERNYLIPELKSAGIEVIASNVNYIFVKDSCSCEKPLHELLFEKGILIRNCDNYHGLGPGYYRICIRKHDENVKLIKILNEVKSQTVSRSE
jgi:threonine-phosphate decarboxylase